MAGEGTVGHDDAVPGDAVAEAGQDMADEPGEASPAVAATSP